MKKTLNFGKIAYSSKIKINSVNIEFELKYIPIASDYNTLETVKNVPVLSICGSIWDSKHYDIESGGQNIDEIAGYFKGNKKVQRIREIWEKYHLNDMQAGTKRQTEAIEAWKQAGNKYDYSQACEYLKSIDLFIDRVYKYGHDWLYMPIPEDILTEVKSW